MKTYKICLVCSAGGHLNQIKELIDPLLKVSDVYLVTLDREDSRTLLKSNVRHYFIRDIRDRGNLFHNFTDSLKVFLREKPDIVITTGAGSALSTCLLAKMFFKKVIYIESFARVEEPSAFGKFISRFANHVLFQWPKLKNYYRKGVYAGSIFNINLNSGEKKMEQVFITVGSTEFQFNRLLKDIDDLIDQGIIKQKVIAQIGTCEYVPRNFEHFKWCSFVEMQKLMLQSKYTITHSGTGSIVNALQMGAKVITVPRLAKYGEHLDNHQLEIANEFKALGLLIVSNSPVELKNAVIKMEHFAPKGSLNNHKFFKVLSEVLKMPVVAGTDKAIEVKEIN
jgi:UDP-N-acetylglucosamine transferase subunit ALG13